MEKRLKILRIKFKQKLNVSKERQFSLKNLYNFKRFKKLLKNPILKYSYSKKIKIWILKKNPRIGIEQVHIKHIFRNKKKSLRKNENKFSRKLIKFYQIDKLKKKKLFNNMIYKLKTLM